MCQVLPGVVAVRTHPVAVVFGVLCFAVLSPSSNVEYDLGCFVVFSILAAKKQQE